MFPIKLFFLLGFFLVHSFYYRNPLARVKLKGSVKFSKDEIKGMIYETANFRLDQLRTNSSINLNFYNSIGIEFDFQIVKFKSTLEELIYEDSMNRLVQNHSYPKELLKCKYEPVYAMFDPVFQGKFPSNIIPRVTDIGMVYSSISSTLFKDIREMNFSNPTLLKSKTPFETMMDVHTNIFPDQSILETHVLSNMEKYIVKDTNFLPNILNLRDSGKKTLLISDRSWEYVNRVMSFLIGDFLGKYKGPDGSIIQNWKELFDFILVGIEKTLFCSNIQQDFFRILQNDTLYPINQTQFSGLKLKLKDEESTDEHQFKVFQGGNWRTLFKALKIKTPERLLVVGDPFLVNSLSSKNMSSPSLPLDQFQQKFYSDFFNVTDTNIPFLLNSEEYNETQLRRQIINDEDS